MIAEAGRLTVEAPKANSKMYEEGMIAGLIAAATIAVWFMLLDVFQGHPLYTPTALGTALFRGGEGLGPPNNIRISLQMVMMFTWIHGLVFVAIGVAVAWLVRMAKRDPNYGFGILLLFVVFEFGFIGVSLVFAEAVLHALTLPAILIGNLLAAATMTGYFWRRHPDLTIHP